MVVFLNSSTAKSESVQYFQFDKDGNLYVFEPGAGCLGPCVKVDSGFELYDVSQVNVFTGNFTASGSLLDVTITSTDSVYDLTQNIIEPTPQTRLNFLLFVT